jgi:transketolase C-terminal domain/subunit
MTDHSEMEMRVVYARTLNELIERNPNVFCLEADLAKADATIPEVSGPAPARTSSTAGCRRPT